MLPQPLLSLGDESSLRHIKDGGRIVRTPSAIVELLLSNYNYDGVSRDLFVTAEFPLPLAQIERSLSENTKDLLTVPWHILLHSGTLHASFTGIPSGL